MAVAISSQCGDKDTGFWLVVYKPFLFSSEELQRWFVEVG